MSASIVPGRVSVVIPAYDAERVVGAAVSSALTQTHPDVEVVVVDDGSTDRTASVLRGFDGLVVLVTQENAGPSAARNAAIRASSGEFIALCDSDDLLLPHHVERSLALLRASGSQRWVTADAWGLGPDGVDWRRRVLYFRQAPPAGQLDDFLATNPTSMFALFPRALFDEVGGYDEQLSHCEDWDFWLRAVLAGWRVVFADEPTAFYRSSPGSLSTATAQMADGQERTLRKALEQTEHPLTATQRDAVQLRLANPSVLELLPRADELFRAGELTEAAELYALAVRLNPADVRLRRKARILTAAPEAILRPVLRRRGVIA